MIKVIRAKAGIHVPANPEDLSSSTRLVQTGLLTLVSSEFKLDKSLYEDVVLSEKKESTKEVKKEVPKKEVKQKVNKKLR